MGWYDGSRLMNMRDLDGDVPELFFCTSNKSAGKTTFFNRFFVSRFLSHNEKFILLFRYSYELDNVADKFFKDISSLFFNNIPISQEKKDSGKYVQLLIDDREAGYAISLNDVDYVKKTSHFFSDAQRILFDEFMPESGKYLKNEPEKLFAIHTAVARGQGQHRRYVPVYMISNPVTLLNPYYVQLGIADRLKSETHFLRGRGWVLEQGFNASAAEAQKKSGIYKAFENTQIAAYGNQGVYLNDKKCFIETPKGKNRYIATIRVDGTDYSIRNYESEGILFVDTSVDATCPIKISLSVSDHNIDYIMFNQYRYLFQTFKNMFECGRVRFKNMRAKSAFFTLLSNLT